MRKITLAAVALSAVALAGGFAASANASTPAPKPHVTQHTANNDCPGGQWGETGAVGKPGQAGGIAVGGNGNGRGITLPRPSGNTGPADCGSTGAVQGQTRR